MNWERVMTSCLKPGDEYLITKEMNRYSINVRRTGVFTIRKTVPNGNRNKVCRTAVKLLAEKGIISNDDLANALLNSH